MEKNTLAVPVTSHADIEGWFDYHLLYDSAVEKAGNNSIFVEVGCWLGKSTAYLAQRIKESGKAITLYAIDHGFGSPNGDDYYLHLPILERYGGNIGGKFIHNLQQCGVLDVVTPIIATSGKASKLFGDRMVDFVFIDAAHDPKSVRQDLELWWPKVTTGGTMAGHDYDGCWLGVVDTVDEFFGGEYRKFQLSDKNCPNCWSRERGIARHDP